jgi:opacity protein-like surface antigen
VLRHLLPVHRTLLSLVVVWLLVTDATAAEYVVTPSLKLQGTYDDNVYFKEVDDFEVRATPGLEIEARKDTAELKVTGVVDISEYLKHDEFSTVEQDYGLSGMVFLTPTLRVSCDGRYVNDYTFRSALEESGLLAERSERKKASFTPGVFIVMDARNRLELGYDFERTEYSFEGYSDYWMQGVTGAWVHDLTEETVSLSLVAGGYLVDFDLDQNDLRQYTYFSLAGAEYRLTESLKIKFNGGIRHTKSESRQYGDTERQRNSGFVGGGSVDWRGERMGFLAGFRRDLSPSIDSEIIIRNRGYADLFYRFTEKLRGQLKANYFRSKTEDVVEEQKRHTFSVAPLLSYKLREEIRLQLGYRYTATENEVTNRSKDRNRVFLGLEMSWPKQY